MQTFLRFLAVRRCMGPHFRQNTRNFQINEHTNGKINEIPDKFMVNMYIVFVMGIRYNNERTLHFRIPGKGKSSLELFVP